MADTQDRELEVNELIENIEYNTNADIPLYQVSRSINLREDLFAMLQVLNMNTYQYMLDIEDYIRDNIKDASFLKNSLIEKIKWNLGE